MRHLLTQLGLLTLGVATLGCGSDGKDSCNEPGTACVWAGTGFRGFNIDKPNANRLDSLLYFPEDLTFGPDGRAYIVDWNNHRIRRVEKDGKVTVVMGTDYEGDGPPEMNDRLPECSPAGAPGTTVAMNHMTDVEFGPDGKLYVAAWHNNKIRILDTATGITTAIGNGYGYAGDGGMACNALFNQPKSIVFGDDGTLYTIDQRNTMIRALTTDGMIKPIAGKQNAPGFSDGKDSQALDAQFGFETGTTPRPTGSLVIIGRMLYVADSVNNRIRRIDLDTGVIGTIAGKADAGYSGDGGAMLDAQFHFPSDMELGPDGRLYIADRYNHVVRALDLASNTVETVAGSGETCDTFDVDCPVDGLGAREFAMNEPYGLAFDGAGDLFIADTHNHRIIKVNL